jgi:hypothetical protein
MRFLIRNSETGAPLGGLFLILLCVILFPLKAFALTLSPATVKLETEPGVAQTFKLKVTNEGKKKIVVIPSVEEIGFTKKGKKIYLPIGSYPFSIAKYINLPKNTFELNPDETREINCSINVPKGINGGNRAIVFFSGEPYVPPSVKYKSRVKMAVKLGATILQETRGTTVIKSRIKDAIVSIKADKSLSMALRVLNEGNTHFYGSATVAILGKDDTFIGTLEMPQTLVFPGREGILRGKLNMKIAPGYYNALITYQFKDKNITINKPFLIK